MQQSFFYPNSISGAENNENKKDIIRIRSGKISSPLHIAFNKLVEKTEILAKKLERKKTELDEYNKYFTAHIFPQLSLVAREQIKLAHTFHEAKEKMARHIIEKKTDVIVYLLDEAFSQVEPSDEDIMLYNQYDSVTYEERIKEQKSFHAEMASDFFKDEFGVDIDPEELMNENPDMEKIEAKMREQFENNKKSTRKKTKKQLDKEIREKKAEELSNKNIRTVYLALAKLLHPDTEVDEEKKQEKEEYMKKVTAAYKNKDLLGILRLETMWIGNTADSLKNISDELLQTYISVLKEKVKQLREEEASLLHHPAYTNIFEYVMPGPKETFFVMDQVKARDVKKLSTYTDMNQELKTTTRLRTLLTDAINFLYDEIDDFDEDEDEDEDFDDFFKRMFDNSN